MEPIEKPGKFIGPRGLCVSRKLGTRPYKELIEKLNKKCAICGALIEPHVFGGIDTDTSLCSYHNHTKGKD